MFLNKKRKSSAPKEIIDDGNKNCNYNINSAGLSQFSDKISNSKNEKSENNTIK